MDLKVFTDGGSLNNPGQAAIAFIIYIDNKIVQTYSRKIGVNTNNFAEYSALTNALVWIRDNTVEKLVNKYACVRVPLLLQPNENKQAEPILKIICFSDSSLMVNQLNGLFKVKNHSIRDFIIKIRVLEQEIKIPILYRYIPRERNTEADSLIKKELSSF